MKTISTQFVWITTIILLLISCSKEVKNNRRLNGIWTIDELYIQSDKGLKTQAQHSGTLQFQSDGKKTQSGKYVFDFSILYKDSLILVNERGDYQIYNETDLKFSTQQNNAIFNDGMVVYSTKKDLVLDMGTNFKLRSFFTLKRL